MFLQHRQQGVALITALLVVSLAAVLAASLVKHLNYDIRRSENILRLDQAQLFNKNSVEFAMVLISRDRQLNNKIDTIEDIQTFNDYAIAIALDGPPVSLELVDLQSCFNLNNLTTANTDLPKMRAQYSKLLTSLEIDINTHRTLTDSLIDWMDGDKQNQAQGAEFDYYIGLDRPYLTADAPLTSISELRLVKGYTGAVIDKLEGTVCVLPNANSGININTASSIMLDSIEGLGGFGEQIVKDRDGDINTDNTDNNINDINAKDVNALDTSNTNPFDDLAEFTKYVKDVLKVEKFDAKGLQVYSEYFLIESRTQLGTGNVKLFSIVYRDNSKNNGETKLINQTSGAL